MWQQISEVGVHPSSHSETFLSFSKGITWSLTQLLDSAQSLRSLGDTQLFKRYQLCPCPLSSDLQANRQVTLLSTTTITPNVQQKTNKINAVKFSILKRMANTILTNDEILLDRNEWQRVPTLPGKQDSWLNSGSLLGWEWGQGDLREKTDSLVHLPAGNRLWLWKILSSVILSSNIWSEHKKVCAPKEVIKN